MRQAGILFNRSLAEMFLADLGREGIEGRVDPGAGGWEIWVYDEDQIARARAAFEQFVSRLDPAALVPTIEAAEAPAPPVPEPAAAAMPRRIPRRYRGVTVLYRGVPLATLVLIGLSVLMAAVTGFGSAEPVTDWLMMSGHLARSAESGPWLPEIRGGQVWRLLTPTLLHFNVGHLAYNLIALYVFGGMVERRGGTLWLLLVTLLLAVSSNLAEYFVHVAQDDPSGFGGMSGVVYGLFGYAWVRSQLDPDSGYLVPEGTVVMMVLLFLLCLTGWLGPIANGAHAGGLVVGVLLAYGVGLVRLADR